MAFKYKNNNVLKILHSYLLWWCWCAVC